MKHYQKISFNSYKIITIALCAIGDALIMTYIWKIFTNFKRIQPIVEMSLSAQNIQLRDLPSDFLPNLHLLIVNSLVLFFTLIVLFHLIIYFFFYKEKDSPWLYIKILTILGCLGCWVIGLPAITYPKSLGFLVFFQGFAYLWVALGLFHFDKKRGITN